MTASDGTGQDPEPELDPLDALVDELRGVGAPSDSSATPGTGSSSAASLEIATADALFGLDRYTLVNRLGGGSMGVVYEAIDERLGRSVALKLLPPCYQGDPHRTARFVQEAKSASRCDHPAIVKIYEVGSQGSQWYISQELVQGGRTLRHWINEQRLLEGQERSSFRFIAELFLVLADALDSAHAAEVIHRDIKPANILMDGDQRPLIADFGLALATNEIGISRSGDSPGTPRFQAPEQLDRSVGKGKAGPLSDQFSLGVTFYEALSFTHPFTGETLTELRDEILAGDPEDPRKRRRSIPRELSIICLKMLSLDPGDRYPSLGEVREDLERYLTGRPILAHEPGPLVVGMKWAKRRRRTLSLVGTTLVAILAAVAWFQSSRSAEVYAREMSRTRRLEQEARWTRAIEDAMWVTTEVPVRAERLARFDDEIASALASASWKTPLGALSQQDSVRFGNWLGERTPEFREHTLHALYQLGLVRLFEGDSSREGWEAIGTAWSVDDEPWRRWLVMACALETALGPEHWFPKAIVSALLESNQFVGRIGLDAVLAMDVTRVLDGKVAAATVGTSAAGFVEANGLVFARLAFLTASDRVANAEKALVMRPHSVGAKAALAQGHYYARRGKVAKPIAREVLTEEPRWLNLASNYVRSLTGDEAREFFWASVRADEETSLGFEGLAAIAVNAMFKLDDRADKLEIGHEIFARVPSNAHRALSLQEQSHLSTIIANHADVLYSQGKGLEAMEVYERSVHLHSRPKVRASNLQTLAFLRMLYGDLQGGREAAQLAIDTGMGWAVPRMQIARSLRHEERWDESLPYLAAVLRTDANFVRAGKMHKLDPFAPNALRDFEKEEFDSQGVPFEPALQAELESWIEAAEWSDPHWIRQYER